jgi:hypothetical protein
VPETATNMHPDRAPPERGAAGRSGSIPKMFVSRSAFPSDAPRGAPIPKNRQRYVPGPSPRGSLKPVPLVALAGSTMQTVVQISPGRATAPSRAKRHPAVAPAGGGRGSSARCVSRHCER